SRIIAAWASAAMPASQASTTATASRPASHDAHETSLGRDEIGDYIPILSRKSRGHWFAALREPTPSRLGSQATTLPLPFAERGVRSMPEMSRPGEHHGDAGVVGSLDHLVVAHRAAGLDHRGRARLDRDQE